MVGPTASLSNLNRSDGSASYKCPTTGYSVLGSVNAPVELPARKDALKPEEATVEVFVKPGNTTAGIGERYVEGILRSVLQKVILGRERGFPRRGVVITLAIMAGEAVQRGDSYISLLPALLQASLLALLSAAVPLSMTFSTALVGVTKSGEIITNPSADDVKIAASLHTLTFSSKGHLLLNESQGYFDFDIWESVRERALSICQDSGRTRPDGDVAMSDEPDSIRLDGFVRETVEDRIHRDYSWKIDSI
ncbi:hypothetical protein N7462_006625 [Penicillium macrosclerotiorum]|uniref:uncharacterized protein n=1 Tax=Penicillium macrosclerotiorum TaxID=303699 RepID=UPI002548727F|nr:uncharacterized protein N7462_006625 [Penicillium macrosclerotiorum]KAJ5683460.1 hypothetical protein N7462_006625 [Penicillium macrosclerotiorum]